MRVEIKELNQPGQVVQHLSNGAQLEFETIHKLPVKREVIDEKAHVVGFSFNDNKRQAGK